MCKFFSIITEPESDKIYFFDNEIRNKLKIDNPESYKFDSHTSIADYFGINEDICNKYEYDPFNKKFVIDQINSKINDRNKIEKFCQTFDFKSIIIVGNFTINFYNINLEFVKTILEYGLDVNIKDNDGDTALIWASMYDYTEVVKLLLESGADVNIKNNYGNTALIWASYNGHTEIVKLLLESGADVNIKNKFGNTALIQASINGNTEVVKLLENR